MQGYVMPHVCGEWLKFLSTSGENQGRFYFDKITGSRDQALGAPHR
jgi:hypothetical protein